VPFVLEQEGDRTILMEQSGGLFPAGQGPGRSIRGEAEVIDSRTRTDS
jgi:hypothetical protein